MKEAAHATHSVCNRSTPVERRSRRRIATAPPMRLPRMPSHSGTQIHSSQSGTSMPANGLCTASFGGSNGSGSSNAIEMKPMKHAVPAIATLRQRRVSSRPFGNTYATAIGHA